MPRSIGEQLAIWLDAVIRFLWPEADPSFPAWLYAISDLLWLLIFQVFFTAVVYLRVRSTAKRVRSIETILSETCGNDKLIWMELMNKTAEITEAVRESGAETEEQLRLEIGDKVTDLAIRISRLRQDMHNGGTQ